MTTGRCSALTISHIHDYSAFLGLREDWNALAADRSVFLRHEWFDAAWQWRQREKPTNLAILSAFRGQRLVGIFPLVHRLDRVQGMSRRILEFLTVPDTQFCDILAAPAEEHAVADAMATELSVGRGDWDVLRLSFLPASSIVERELLPGLGRRDIRATLSESSGNPYIVLDDSWGNYFAARSRSLKKACNLAANRLNKAGNLRIDWLAPGSNAATAQDWLDAAIAVSATSWKRSTGKSLDNPAPRAFFRRISELALNQGWLSLWLLMLDDKPIATEYQLIYAGRVHALRSDFVEEYDELSPGTHLNRYLLEQLFDRGLHRYLMGPGDNPYKKRWTDQAEPLFGLDAYSPTARGRVAALWDMKLKPALRRLKAAAVGRREVGPQ